MDEDKESERTKAYAQTLWDTALLESGFEIEAPKEFNARIYSLLADAYSIKGDLGLSEEEVKAAAAEEVRAPNIIRSSCQATVMRKRVCLADAGMKVPSNCT